MTPWEIEAREFVSCNCDYGCPCQFNALPTHGFCEAAAGMEITRGHYGGVDLTGVRCGAIFHWPGAIHEGGGSCQPFVDIRATDKQRMAILTIMSGADTDPGTTMFSVYMSTMVEVHEPIFAKMDLEIDVSARRSHILVDGVMESTASPILNPLTGQEHRAQIVLPGGFEYSVAEMGSAVTRTHGAIELAFDNSYAQLAEIHLNNHGVVRH